MEDMLRHFVRTDQTNWDELLPMVEFAINNSHHESLNFKIEGCNKHKLTPFLLNYGRTPRTPVSMLAKSAWSEKALPLEVHRFISDLHESHAYAKQCLEAAQQRQKAYADRSRTPLELHIGQQVLLATKNITLKQVGSAKLLPRFIGPFTVKQRINEVAYRLDLPPSMKIHDVFHVSLLKPYLDDGKRKPPPPPALVDSKLEYEVEQILLHRERKAGKRTHKGCNRRVYITD